jgi:transposase-like protein
VVLARRLTTEEVIAIKALSDRGVPKRLIARQLGVDDKAVRYQVQKFETGRKDGRRNAEPKPGAAMLGAPKPALNGVRRQARDAENEGEKNGAGDEIRTHDPHVGNVMLYH